MKSFPKMLIVLSISAFVLVGIPALMYMSYNNTEVSLRNQIKAQQRSNEAVFDNTWKIISQAAGVTSEYKNAFVEIYPKLMDSRYSTGGDMMKWIKESNPEFDTSLYKKLMTAIEAQRTRFTNEQRRLLDLKREHDDILVKLPSSFFVGSRGEVDVNIVTSTKTTKTFDSGVEDDIDLFDKK